MKITPIGHGKSWEDARRVRRWLRPLEETGKTNTETLKSVTKWILGENEWRMWPRKLKISRSEWRTKVQIFGKTQPPGCLQEKTGSGRDFPPPDVPSDDSEQLPVAVDVAPPTLTLLQRGGMAPAPGSPPSSSGLLKRARFKYLRALRPRCGPGWSRTEGGDQAPRRRSLTVTKLE